MRGHEFLTSGILNAELESDSHRRVIVLTTQGTLVGFDFV